MANRHRNGTGDAPIGNDVNVLDTRVGVLERSQRDLAGSLAELSSHLDSTIKSLEAGIGRQMDALSTKIEERSRIPWPALGVMLSFLVVIGGMAYYPIQNTQARLEATLLRFDERFVNKELEWRLAATAQRRDDFQRPAEARFERVESDISGIRKEIVPRAEHAEKWRGADHQRGDLQRQVEELKRQFGDTFSLRDALIQMQRRIDALEGQNIPPPRG